MTKVPRNALVSLFFVSCAVLLGVFYLPTTSYFPRTAYGEILHEENSAFSHIRVRGTERRRHLLFVTGSGKEQLQSSVDLENPGELQVAYTRALFASLLFRHPQENALIVGLGGGGMVRFIERHLPATDLEVVEIDPAVVRIAADWFETREKPGITIHTADAFDFLAGDCGPYDVIYLDAFLRPSVDLEADGKTARLKTVSFLRTMRSRLKPEGLLACNLIAHRTSTPSDLAALREVFPTVVTLPVAGTGNLAVFAGGESMSLTREERISAGKKLENTLPSNLPFSAYADRIRE